MNKNENSKTVVSVPGEILTSQNISDILKREACKHCDAKSTDKFVTANLLTCYVAMNSWLLMAADLAPKNWRNLLTLITFKGISFAVAAASSAADDVVRGRALPFGFESICAEVSDKKLALQFLRFPKRLTLTASNMLEETTFSKFLSANEKCKPAVLDEPCCYGHRCSSRPLMEFFYPSAHSHMEQCLSRISQIISEMTASYIKGQCSFSSGTTREGDGKFLSAKLQHLAYDNCTYYGYPLIPDPSKAPSPDGYFTGQDRASLGQCVPKNYKTYRFIAKEGAARQFRAQGIRDGLEAAIGNSPYGYWADIRDQGRNQELARIGSLGLGYCTVDLSSASDLNRWSLVQRLFPKAVVTDLADVRPEYCYINGKRYKLYMFATAGNATTFIVEVIVFYAIARYCTEYVQIFFEDTLNDPSAYGDDIIVDERVYDYLVYILEELGFVVNMEKSFSGSELLYRESCGVEFEDGVDLSTIYFPRKSLGRNLQNPATIETLCSLQHSMYEYVGVRAFLTLLVRQAMPKMTSHRPGSLQPDLWEDYPQIVTRPLAAYKIVNKKLVKCDATVCSDVLDRQFSYKLVPTFARDQNEVTFFERANVDVYNYVTFLQYGPKPFTEDDDPAYMLLNSLGVTQPYSSKAQFETPALAWKLIQE